MFWHRKYGFLEQYLKNYFWAQTKGFSFLVQTSICPGLESNNGHKSFLPCSEHRPETGQAISPASVLNYAIVLSQLLEMARMLQVFFTMTVLYMGQAKNGWWQQEDWEHVLILYAHFLKKCFRHFRCKGSQSNLIKPFCLKIQNKMQMAEVLSWRKWVIKWAGCTERWFSP